MRINKVVGLLLKLLVSGAVFAFVLSRLDLGAVMRVFSTANVFFLVAALMLGILLQMLNAWKIKVLLPGRRIEYWYILFTNFAANIIRMTVPTELGAEVGRAYYFGKRIGTTGPAISAIVLDRYLGITSQFFVLGIASIVVGTVTDSPFWLRIGIGTASLACVLAAATMLCRFVPVVRESTRRGLRRVTRVAASFSESLAAFRGRLRWIIAAGGISIVFQGTVLLMIMCVSAAFDEVLTFHEAAVIAILSTIGFFVPFTIAGFGIVEGIYAGMFQYFAHDQEIGFAVSLSMRMITIFMAGLGVLFFVVEGRREKKG